MEIKAIAGDLLQVAADGLLVNLFEGVEHPGGATGAVDRALSGAISQLIAQGEIKGKLGEVTVVHTLGKIAPLRVAVLGLGKEKELNQDRVCRAVGEGCRRLRQAGAERIASIAHGAGAGGISPIQSAQAVVEGCVLGLYAFRRHYTKLQDKEVKEFWLVEQDQAKLPELERGAFLGRVMAKATNQARDMVNEPANFMTPTQLAEEARKIAEKGGLGVKVLEREEMKELGMGGLLGVAQGSHNPPQFIVLEYKGSSPEAPPLGFIGKGVTFDAGGLHLKSAEHMTGMKGDMAGAAAVIVAMGAIAQLKPRLNVTALIPATENMPGGGAFRPGDVLQIMNSKTVEIGSTDAEGRLMLADALSYAQRLGLRPLIDLATLTGACHVALGDYYSGLLSNNQEWQEKVIQAGKEAGERHWPLPLEEDYREQLKSEVADVKNIGGMYGGAITAALFLSEFVGDTPWVHLDIAGTARIEKDWGYQVKGATGVGARTLVNLALSLEEKK